MDTHLATIKEVFTEIQKLAGNVIWFVRYQATITVKVTDKEGYNLKPRKYTFETINLCNVFENQLQQLQAKSKK